ncbi:MAG: DNA-formamidopyrimidine glycosylase family protein [Candidatus Saccharimonadales bacterium]
MIELPEARTIAKDLRKEILGKTIVEVKGNFVDHKFTFYQPDPNSFAAILGGKKITNVIDRNYYIEIEAGDFSITFRDGANIRYLPPNSEEPKKSKLYLLFDDGSALNVTVQMYAFIGIFEKGSPTNNEYYDKELSGIGALDEKFTYAYFKSLITEETEKLSLKAFLATQQRILGLGNGVLQDILFFAHANPRTKVKDLPESRLKDIYDSIRQTLTTMIEQGGRDTEKNIYGNTGNYETIMSSKNYQNGCPACGGAIKKEAYLGGSVYYCPSCQKI